MRARLAANEGSPDRSFDSMRFMRRTACTGGTETLPRSC
jgi:hypothetical protein